MESIFERDAAASLDNSWLQSLREKFARDIGQNNNDLEITPEIMAGALSRFRNWASLGPDGSARNNSWPLVIF